jgi:hypothetical protein
MKLGDYVYDTTRRELAGRVVKITNAHVTIETRFRASPTGPWFVQQHRIRKVNADRLQVPTLDPKTRSTWEYVASFQALVDGTSDNILRPIRGNDYVIGDKIHIYEQTWPDRKDTGRILSVTVIAVTEEGESMRLKLRIDTLLPAILDEV